MTEKGNKRVFLSPLKKFQVVHIHTHTQIHTHTNTNTQTQTHTHIHTHTYIHTHTGFEKVLKLLPSPLDDLNMEWVVLESLPGCHQQGAHIDYVFDTKKRLKAADISHGCLLAVQNGTKFDVWPAAHRLLVRDYSHDHVAIERCTLLLSKGDLVVFRADCVHAGAAYDEYNVRLHCFIDTTSMPHTTNRVGRYKTLNLPANVLREA